MYCDERSGLVSSEDPRLGRLPYGWERVAQETPNAFDTRETQFLNKVTGDRMTSEPRFSVEELMKSDVDLRDVRLV